MKTAPAPFSLAGPGRPPPRPRNRTHRYPPLPSLPSSRRSPLGLAAPGQDPLFPLSHYTCSPAFLPRFPVTAGPRGRAHSPPAAYPSPLGHDTGRAASAASSPHRAVPGALIASGPLRFLTNRSLQPSVGMTQWLERRGLQKPLEIRRCLFHGCRSAPRAQCACAPSAPPLRPARGHPSRPRPLRRLVVETVRAPGLGLELALGSVCKGGPAKKLFSY